MCLCFTPSLSEAPHLLLCTKRMYRGTFWTSFLQRKCIPPPSPLFYLPLTRNAWLTTAPLKEVKGQTKQSGVMATCVPPTRIVRLKVGGSNELSVKPLRMLPCVWAKVCATYRQDTHTCNAPALWKGPFQFALWNNQAKSLSAMLFKSSAYRSIRWRACCSDVCLQLLHVHALVSGLLVCTGDIPV